MDSEASVSKALKRQNANRLGFVRTTSRVGGASLSGTGRCALPPALAAIPAAILLGENKRASTGSDLCIAMWEA